VAPAADEDASRAGAAAPLDSSGSSAAPAAPDPSSFVYDYISLITRLGSLPLGKVGDMVVVRVVTSDGVVPMRIEVGQERTRQRTITDLSSGARRRVDLRELRLRFTPIGASSPKAKGFLDMEGESELWMDAESGILTEISGTIPRVPGRVVITLDGCR
jgi:hypothetical protein